MKINHFPLFLLVCCFFTQKTSAQSFLFGADLSYVNEMEDCGVVYQENGTAKDPSCVKCFIS